MPTLVLRPHLTGPVRNPARHSSEDSWACSTGEEPALFNLVEVDQRTWGAAEHGLRSRRDRRGIAGERRPLS